MRYDSAPVPQIIRLVLAEQDQNIRQLRAIISEVDAENIGETHQMLAEQIQKMEAIEQELWAALFPSCAGTYTLEHRMTMFPMQSSESHTGHIW